jgi:hypothetical protein
MTTLTLDDATVALDAAVKAHEADDATAAANAADALRQVQATLAAAQAQITIDDALIVQEKAIIAADASQIADLNAQLQAALAQLGKPTDLPGWKLDRVEEFGGTALDPTMWKAYQGAVNTDEGYNDINQIKVANNQLSIVQARKDVKLANGEVRHFIEGYCNGPGTAGIPPYTLPDNFRIATRSKASSSIGAWSAMLWLRPTSLDCAAEIDLPECYAHQPNHIAYTVHYGHSYDKNDAIDPHTMTHKNVDDPKLDAFGWHDHVLEKVKGKMTFWLDGKVVGTVSAADSPKYSKYYDAGHRWFMKICLETGRATPAPPLTQTTFDPMLVDHVYTWVPAS